MENKNSKVIFRVKEGVAPEEVLPNTILEEGEPIKVNRLYDIGEEVASFRGASPMDLEEEDEADNNALFETEIYPNKPEPEKKLFRTYVAESSPATVNSLLESLQDNEDVEYAQLDEMNDLYLHPNDPLLSQLWGITKIGCPTAWDTTLGEEIIVAVIDTGVDYNHPDIRQSMWTDAQGNHGRDFSDGDPDPLDFHGHGSHCAGTIAATINNATGVVGVAPRAKIMALKIFPNALDSVCAEAIRFAAANGAHVLSNSWGPRDRRPTNQAVADAIDFAISRGCIVVFAAGNSDDDVQFFAPANHPSVISVAATDINDARAGFSNFGDSITVAAPGVNILSLKLNTNEYTSKSGTSMACPHVSGLVALILSRGGSVTVNQMKQILRANADSIQTDKPISNRRINAQRTVGAINVPHGNGSNGNNSVGTVFVEDKEESSL